ncbi:unannotated protein [freshwater metagenome]|uniref:Unannotated protein n=1 Tax=freshwater metagenome TaxID=449393 RepID=A0A6J7AS98_9ZZZZ
MNITPRVAPTVGLDAQQLLLVVPLVQRFGLVEPFVALQTNQPGTGHIGDALGQLGLPRAGRTFDKDRLAETIGEEGDAGNTVVGEVVHVSQAITDLLDALETMSHAGHPTVDAGRTVNRNERCILMAVASRSTAVSIRVMNHAGPRGRFGRLEGHRAFEGHWSCGDGRARTGRHSRALGSGTSAVFHSPCPTRAGPGRLTVRATRSPGHHAHRGHPTSGSRRSGVRHGGVQRRLGEYCPGPCRPHPPTVRCSSRRGFCGAHPGPHRARATGRRRHR